MSHTDASTSSDSDVRKNTVPGNSGFYGLLKNTVIGPPLRLAFRPLTEGARDFPAEGPVLLVANHQSFADSLFMPMATPRPVKFLAKAEYFTGRGVKGRLSAGFFRGVGSIPIDRSGATAADPALTTALRLLSEGHVVGMYPEGTRSPDGRLYKGRTGVARIALTARCPVVPCAIFGTRRVQPTGRRVPVPTLHPSGRVRVWFGKPLDFSRYTGPDGEAWNELAGTEAERVVLRAVTDEIMLTLERMTGSEYVDVYASTLKKATK
ncbi:MAG TPA: lysophospholipid acyltransferase family protein [Actinocrinis sp.]|uniref:lysophospholipid acyltransferase family protein n=1 Tax=Actinocrinis sp. TaxID=1920516 RepID=UPI002DDD2A6A|nr:lysophospholipid acyltransferase family protein [Actinocrinis sp.]HEV2342890.1 lysophospholipid acyltransferase family protein [Actinocrinis sp.]